MLHVPVQYIRQAVDALSSEFTGESFPFDDRNWRIGPSDVKRIQAWIIDHEEQLRADALAASRRIRAKRLVSKQPSQEQP